MTQPQVTQPTEEMPVRYCHGCGQWDDHPRAHAIVNADNVAQDKLYHYDCIPPEWLEGHGEKIQPMLDATAEGKRGEEVRAVGKAHAESIVEDSAHPLEEQPVYKDAMRLLDEQRAQRASAGVTPTQAVEA